MRFEDNINSSFQEHQLSEDVADVQLKTDLVTTVDKFLGLCPHRRAAEKVKESFDHHQEKI